jgi:hypothetical protein
VALEIAILIERISRTKETAIGQPRGTVRLMVDVRQEIMNRAEMYLRHLKDTASPMSRRTLVETALTEYLDGKNNSERDALFTAVAAIRDRQRDIRSTLELLGEAHFLFVHQLIARQRPVLVRDLDQAKSLARKEFEQILDELKANLETGGKLVHFLKEMVPKREDHSARAIPNKED